MPNNNQFNSSYTDNKSLKYITGKELTANDFTDTLKTKLDGVQDGAQVNVRADWNATSGDSEILNKPKIPTSTLDLNDATNRRYVTDANLATIANQSGTNTGDNATNSQYSGLASSKQDTLVSATNIKTINGTSILGSGDLVVSGGSNIVACHTFLKPAAGQQVGPYLNTSGTTTIATVADRITLVPYIPANTVTTTSLIINVTTLGIGVNGRILIYSDLNGTPTTKLYESASLSCATIGVKTVTVTTTFTAGTVYWIGCYFSGVCTIGAFSGTQLIPVAATISGFFSNIRSTQTFGSAPTTLTLQTFATGNAPYVGLFL
jgi:hypothetical protein